MAKIDRIIEGDYICLGGCQKLEEGSSLIFKIFTPQLIGVCAMVKLVVITIGAGSIMLNAQHPHA